MAIGTAASGTTAKPAPKPRIVLIIPAWNEAEALRLVLPGIPPAAVDEVIVVDGGSCDGTERVAREAGARVVSQRAPGYGSACLTGALSTDADIVVFMDGDYADDPGELPGVLAPILADQADLVVGTRNGPGSDRDALPVHQRVGNRVAVTLIRLLYGVSLADIGSFRAIRREKLLALEMRQMTYGWPVEMVVRAARHGYRITGVPVRYRRRIGVSKVGGTLRGSLKAGYHMLAVVLSSAWSTPPRRQRGD
jgi:glycosyltransferase involved in cell wall biosynthesis